MPIPFTPTEQRMHNLLADGMPHTKEELQALLDDDLADPKGAAVSAHIGRMRKKMGGQLDIVAYQRQHAYFYRLVIAQPRHDRADDS